MKLAITEPKEFRKIFDFLDFLLMDHKRCLIKIKTMSTSNTMPQNFVKGEFDHHKHCTYTVLYLLCDGKSVKNKTKTNQT